MSLRETVSNRELLWNLTLRELRTRYRRSFLGWAWSMLNPLATMVIFTIVFSVVFKAQPPTGHPSGLHSYPLYLLCGLLPWNFFALSVGSAMGTLLGNAGLVKKVWFPREILVVSSTTSLLVSLGIELGVLSIALMIAGNFVIPWFVPLVLLMLLLASFSVGVGLVFAALNVYYRDINYLWGIISQAWFYLTPVVWTLNAVPIWLVRLSSWQPMGSFIIAARDLLYDLRSPTPARWLQLTVISVVSLAFGELVFSRLSPRFAEEL
jgi:ABC-type polysaccharide/polyol phosphate export permease